MRSGLTSYARGRDDSPGLRTSPTTRSNRNRRRCEYRGDTAEGGCHGRPFGCPWFEVTGGVDGTGVRFFAGFRSDPFFFDLLGFLNNLHFTGSDFFIDKNVFGIALDLPNTLLGTNPSIGVWVRTLVPMTMQPDHLTQA